MNDDHSNILTEKDETLVAILRQSRALPPFGFALRTAERFAAIAAKRQLRRIIALCIGLFVLSSATLWVLVLNFQNAAASTWSGVKAALSLVGFIYTIWDRLPFTCGTLTMAMFSVLLFTFGLLGKVTRHGVLAK